MPFITVRGVWDKPPEQLTNTLLAIGADFTAGTGIDRQHVTVFWDKIGADQQVTAGQVGAQLLVAEILTPDFHDADRVAAMLKALAESLSRQLNRPIASIFINHRVAGSGHVYDAGDIVTW